MTFNSANEKILFYHFPVVLFSLIPFFLITGPFLSDLSISLISLLFLIYCFRKKNFTYFKEKYFFLFLIFWLYLIFNSLINNFNLDSLRISVFFFRYGVFVVAIVTLLNVDSKFIKYFFYCIFICFVALILDGFYQYLSGENIFGWKKYFRTSSFFGEEKILGSYLSRLWPIFFGLSVFIFKKNNKFFFILVAVFILSETLIFLSGDRTAFFYINLSAIFVIILSQKLLKIRLITLFSSILLIITISLFDPIAKERVINQTLDQMNIYGSVNDVDGIYVFSREHTHHYITAYNMFLDNKFLGVGVKNFRKFCKDEKYKISEWSCASHPHNTYVQVLSETGIFGFLFLIISFFYFIKYTSRHLFLRIKGNFFFTDFEICILSGILIYIWPIAPTGNIFSNWLTIAMILNFPFLIWSRKSIST